MHACICIYVYSTINILYDSDVGGSGNKLLISPSKWGPKRLVLFPILRAFSRYMPSGFHSFADAEELLSMADMLVGPGMMWV